MTTMTLSLTIFVVLSGFVAFAFIVAGLTTPHEQASRPRTTSDQFETLYAAHEGRSKIEKDQDGNLSLVRTVNVPDLGIALVKTRRL